VQDKKIPYIGHREVDVDILVFGSIREVIVVWLWEYSTARFKLATSLCMTTAKREDWNIYLCCFF
jgi:hypothetical protein